MGNWKREKLQEEMGQNESCPDVVSTATEKSKSKVHLSEISVDVPSEGEQE